MRLCGVKMASVGSTDGNDVLVVLSSASELFFYSMPYLEEVKKKVGMPIQNLTDFVVSTDRVSLVASAGSSIMVCQ